MNTEPDELEDTHLCIKCNATIVGLSKYIAHRKVNCVRMGTTEHHQGKQVVTASSSTSSAPSSTAADRNNLEQSYDGFHFVEPEATCSYLSKTTASHGGKTSKSLTDAYEPTYDLGADVFFSSLQLQSVSTGGKTSSRPERVKDEQGWHTASNYSDPLLKAVRHQEECDFKPLKFVHSPEASEEEEDDEEPDDFDADAVPDEDEPDHDDHEPDPDEDYVEDGRRQSPPTVPATHTGGKWKPEHRPQLRSTHLARISPTWDEPVDDSHDHPPAEHTHGKWVPGSKQLEYRENIDLTKLQQPNASYWCNICCRRLKTRLNYEQHLRSAYHQRRADAERQLEQANLNLGSLSVAQDFPRLAKHSQPDGEQESKTPAEQRARQRRHRRANLLRCDLCRHSMPRHMIGKHLISHYHYRRLQQERQQRTENPKTLQTILEHMDSIVRQAPFQCLPCRFYANTEQTFQMHWLSKEHVLLTEQLGGDFWCSYCQFECASNEEMWQHLLHATHKEVLLALNRSVPVCIAQRRLLHCTLCSETFLYNVQLRRHLATQHATTADTGSASDDYQCRYRCNLCGAAQRSRVALQRHEKYAHHLSKYYCAPCRMEFETPLEARRHRSLVQHKRQAKRGKRKRQKSSQKQPPEQDIEHMLLEVLGEQQDAAPIGGKQHCGSCGLDFETPQALVQHRQQSHPMDNHACLSCGSSFQTAQALGRHTRNCQPIASGSSAQNDTKKWQCEDCDFSAPYEADLLYHRFFHTRDAAIGKDELLQCPRCPKQFRKHSLRAHLRNHTDERIFECDKCSAKFVRRHNLKNHMDNVHNQPQETPTATTKTSSKDMVTKKKPNPGQTYQCGFCGKILAKKFSLKLHELTHTQPERSHRCHHENCQYAGLTAEALKIHLKSHAEGSHKCSQPNCKYVGKSELHLKRHLKSHGVEQSLNDRKWLSCDQCDFKARIKGHLKRHMQRHSGEKPHKCPHCEFQCSSHDNLRKHIMKTGKHPGKFIYECSSCSEAQSTEIFKTNSFKDYQLHLAIHKK